MDEYEISLDVAPFNPRPDTLMPCVSQNTNLKFDDFVLTSTCFGCWTYKCNKNKHNDYIANIDVIEKNIITLYNSGKIRAGSWTKI